MATDVIFPNPFHGTRHMATGVDPVPVASGTTAQRPTGLTGVFLYWDNDLGKLMAFVGGSWVVTGGSGGGTAASTTFSPTGGIAATDVQAALAELDSEKQAVITAGSTSQYRRGDNSWQTLNGLAVANTPAGNIAATNVQAALNELDSEKEPSLPGSGTTAQYLRGDKTWRTFATELAAQGVEIKIKYTGTAYPSRPPYTGTVIFEGPVMPSTGGTTAGGTPAMAPGDIWRQTAS